MKNVSMILTLALSTVLVACSGGGGDGGNPGPGGGDGPAVGRATIELQKEELYHHSCVDYTVSNQTQCTDVDGSWVSSPTFLELEGSCSKNGTVQNSGNLGSASCSQGDLSATCNVNSPSLGVVALGNVGVLTESARSSCSAVGGTVSLTCTISDKASCQADGGVWTAKAEYCSNAFSTETALNNKCQNYGGKHVVALPTVLVGASSLGKGSNEISVSMNSNWTQPLNEGGTYSRNLSPSNLISTISLDDNGSKYWSGQFFMNVTTSFPESTSQSGTIRANSPVAEYTDGTNYLMLESVVYVFTQP